VFALFLTRAWALGNDAQIAVVIGTVVRKIIGLILVLMSAGAMAQSVDVEKINEGYQTLRSYPSANLHVEMFDLYGEKITPSTMDLSWAWDPTGQDKAVYLKGDESVAGEEVGQISADGATFFSYNIHDRTFLAHDYANTPASSSRLDMLQRMYAISGRRGCYAARFLEEVFGNDNPTYSPWCSGELTYVTTETGPVQDPLTDKLYSPSPAQDFIVYETTGPISRSVVFQRSQVTATDSTTHWVISAIYVSKYDETNPNLPNGFMFTMTIDPVDTAPNAEEFEFVPQSGLEAIPGLAR